MYYKFIGTAFTINGDEVIFTDDILKFNKTCVINVTKNKSFYLSATEISQIRDACIPVKPEEDIEPKEVEDKVNHPSHYTWLKDLCGIEVIDITRHLDFDTGNAIKYILRCGHKSELGYSNKEKTIEDLKKAIFYLNDKISMLEKQ